MSARSNCDESARQAHRRWRRGAGRFVKRRPLEWRRYVKAYARMTQYSCASMMVMTRCVTDGSDGSGE